uniref:Er lumen protein retaining receptor, putative n=1 Tax=Arundo donax TaxID=35708 RepID=A0A0A9DTR5_ARUDO
MLPFGTRAKSVTRVQHHLSEKENTLCFDVKRLQSFKLRFGKYREHTVHEMENILLYNGDEQLMDILVIGWL